MSARDDVQALPPDYTLQDYVLQSVLGRGNFGIVYLASSRLLGISVAIKEYLPVGFATRMQDKTVVPYNDSKREGFEKGRKIFLQEGKILAQLHQKAPLSHIVNIRQIIEANGTVYLVMDYYGGRSLEDYIQSKTTPEARYVEQLLDQLLIALESVHAAGLIHKDIAPDNILLKSNAEAVLIDFGGAREVARGTLLAEELVKAGYSPLEQYSLEKVATLPVGPWSDLYSLAATFYHLITGERPGEALGRIHHDLLLPLVDRRPAGYSINVLMALDWCLRVNPQQRPQSVEALKQVLSGVQKPPKDANFIEMPSQKSVGVTPILLGTVVSIILGLLSWIYFKAPIATLEISATPPHAVVTIDGEDRYFPGMSLRPGQRIKGRVESPGYDAKPFEHVIEEGKNTISVSLKAKPAKLKLKASPANVKVVFDNGEPFNPNAQYFVGDRFTLLISADGYETEKRDWVFENKGENALTVNLKPIKVKLKLSVSPAAAKVALEDGSPFDPDARYSVGARVELLISADGFQTEKREWIFVPGENSLAVNLSAMTRDEEKVGRFLLHVFPADANIVLLGIPDKYQPNMSFPEGEKVKVRVSASGYETVIRAFDIQSGKLNEATIRLEEVAETINYSNQESQEESDQLNGYQRKSFWDGEFEGYMLNGARHGKGAIKYSSGAVYKGDWRNGQQTGFGVYVWPDKTYYEGEFESGVFSGKGRMVWNNGTKYEGQFMSGKLHGYGKMTYSNGSTKVGRWDSGEFVE